MIVSTNLKKLLHSFETMTNADRLRTMAELGQQAASDPKAARLLANLAAGDVYSRMLAAHAYAASGAGAQALAAAGDRSAVVRGAALRALSLVGSDAQIADALEQMPAHRWRDYIQGLLKDQRRTAIDQYLLRLHERGDPQLGPSLPYASAPLVEQLLDAVSETYSRLDWQRLARHHPAIATARLRQLAEAATQFDNRLTANISAALPLIADALPDAALVLLASALRHAPLDRFELSRLAQRRPGALLDVIRQTAAVVRLDWQRLWLRLTPAEQLAGQESGLLRDIAVRTFRRLPPEQRLAVYNQGHLGWRDREGVLAAGLVALLPTAQRQAEAQRHWQLPALQTRPASRLPYLAFMPWDAALSNIEPFLRNPDPLIRAAALPALIGVARYDRERLPDVLALLTARKHEQDPVRLAGLTALADLPPGRWQAEHLPALGQVVRDALDAADCSAATASAAERLLLQLLKFHPEWSAGWIATLVQERGQLSRYDRESTLTDVQVRDQLAPVLLPVLKRWATRERERQITAAAQSFGRRLRVFPGLLDLLERLAFKAVSPWTAEQALSLIIDHDRQRAAHLIPALLKQDASWSTRPAVYDYLHRKRQDLLTPYLARRSFKGRWSSGKTQVVLPFFDGFERWTPEQQTLFAKSLQRILEDSKRDTPTNLWALRSLAALYAVPPTLLNQLADLGNEKLAMREGALRALGTVDSAAGVPTLLAALNDERARIAIYALRAALRELPALQALEILRGVPTTRVTVAKETIRLLGEVRHEEAFHELLAISERDLHRDVRVALLRALWDWTELPATWTVLNEAAGNPDPAIAAGVVRIPADRMSAAAQARLARLLAQLLAHPTPKVRVDVLNRCAQLPLLDAEQALLAPILAGLASPLPDEWTAAGQAMFATYVGRDLPAIRVALTQLLPYRQALFQTVQTLKNNLNQGNFWRSTGQAALEVLAADQLTISLQVQLAVLVFDPAELAAWLGANAQLLHADAQMFAESSLTRLGYSANGTSQLAALEQILFGSADERLRRLGLAALNGLAGGVHGWSAEQRARLLAYQADPAPLVAGAAQWIFPPPEALAEA
jgi:hypothetical protein